MQEKYRSLQEKSANVLQLSDERDQLKTQNADLTSKVGNLQKQAENMLYTGAIRWFLAGGGVFLFGWLIGRSAARTRSGGL